MGKKIYIGKTFGAFGLKGEIKLSFESNLKDIVLKKGNKLIIEDKEYVIDNVRNHNKNELVTFVGFDHINKIQDLTNKEVFFDKDLALLENEYFYDELLNMEIIDEKGNLLGKVEELLYNKNNLYIKSNKLIIPMINKYLVNVDINEGKIFVKDVGELIL